MRRVRLWQVLAIAITVELVGLLATTLTTFLADRAAGAAAWLATPIAAVVAGSAKVLTDALGKQDDEEQPPAAPPPPVPGQPYPPYQPYWTPPPSRRRGTPVWTAVLVVFVLVGAGGYAAAAGVRYVAGYMSGNEPGTDVLARPASQSAAGVTLTVNEVLRTRHFTRVEIAVRNTGTESVSLPLFGNCTLVGADGTVLEADSFRSDWSDTIPPGGAQRGTVTFEGRLPPNVTGATLSFSHVFRLRGGSVSVPVELQPVTTR